MRSFLTLLLFIISLSISAQTRFCSHIDNEFIIQKKFLTISYNTADKIPNYVGYFLTPSNLYGSVPRQSNFYTEKSLPTSARSYSSNYTNSGFDRGHMCPAGNWKNSKTAMYETFSMANVCPQVSQLNKQYWLALENYERKLASNCDTLYVITGQFSLTPFPNYIKNNVRVPEYFYKALICLRSNQIIVSKAWIFENTSSKQTLASRELTIQQLELIIKEELFCGFWFRKFIK